MKFDENRDNIMIEKTHGGIGNKNAEKSSDKSESIIHLRVPMALKTRCVAVSNSENMKLSTWIKNVLADACEKIAVDETELLNIIRSNELINRRIAIQAQIDLIDELDIKDKYQSKLDELFSAMDTINDLIMEIPVNEQRTIKMTKHYGYNAFNWEINNSTLEYFLIEAARECGFSQAAKMLAGYAVSEKNEF